jgi:hypothetical protein
MTVMIRRAPHFGIAYQRDNIMVWHVVRHLFHGGPGWSWIQDYQFTMDGCAAYMSVKTHYLGESFSLRLRSNADAILHYCFYDGQPKGYTFERYCEVLKGVLLTWNPPASLYLKDEKFEFSYNK